MKLRECFQKRLLRKERPDSERSKRSVQVAEAKLDEAERALNHGLFDSTIILAYTAMFHAARAILFRDGIVEKSHVCLIEYLRETYVNNGKLSAALINALDTLRVDRHETLYGLEARSSRKEAQHSVKKAKEFLDTVRKFMKIPQT
jgi:uncharacterized protein (UPF0332 family)